MLIHLPFLYFLCQHIWNGTPPRGCCELALRSLYLFHVFVLASLVYSLSLTSSLPPPLFPPCISSYSPLSYLLYNILMVCASFISCFQFLPVLLVRKAAESAAFALGCCRTKCVQGCVMKQQIPPTDTSESPVKSQLLLDSAAAHRWVCWVVLKHVKHDAISLHFLYCHRTDNAS